MEFIDAPSGGGDDEKVKYNASDVASGYLADKVVAGTGIALAEGTSGDADKLQVSLGNAHSLISLTLRLHIPDLVKRLYL